MYSSLGLPPSGLPMVIATGPPCTVAVVAARCIRSRGIVPIRWSPARVRSVKVSAWSRRGSTLMRGDRPEAGLRPVHRVGELAYRGEDVVEIGRMDVAVPVPEHGRPRSAGHHRGPGAVVHVQAGARRSQRSSPVCQSMPNSASR